MTEPVISSELMTQLAAELSEDQISQVSAEIDIADDSSIAYFGIKPQRALGGISEKLMTGLGRRALAQSSELLGKMVELLNEADFSEFDKKNQSWLGKLFGGASLKELDKRWHALARELDQLAGSVESRKTDLMTDSVMLDRITRQASDILQQIEAHLLAGQRWLESGEANSDQVREMTARLTDLMLSREIGKHAIASMALLQDNNQQLLAKINTAIDHMLPAWQQHLGFLMALWRGEQVTAGADSVVAIGNSDADQSVAIFQKEAKAARDGGSKGEIDVEAIRRANRHLGDVLGDGRQVARESERLRDQAAGELTR